MQRVLTNMTDSLNQVTGLVNTLSNTVKNVGVVMEGVGDAVDGTSESLGQIQSVVDSISDKLTDLTEQLEGASEEEMMDILVRFLGGDPDSLGAYFASPVTMETVAMYPVATYGSAMTPFYSTLAIWVGSTILVALVKVKASPKGLEMHRVISCISADICCFPAGTDSGSHYRSGRSVAAEGQYCGAGIVFPGGKLYGNCIFPVDLFADTGIRRCG